MNKTFQVIGLMSGTSLDGIDLALVEFSEPYEQPHWKLICTETIAYSDEWMARLAYLHQQNAETLAKTNVMYAHLLGKLTADFIRKNKLKPDLVASHGHTIFHQPHKGFTLQIGDGQTFVSYLPCPLVNNFRNKDIAWGGQGAPLVPTGEKALFPDTKQFLNLGGFANISFHDSENVLAWDISACNLVFNWLRASFDQKPYDENGELAASGTKNEQLYESIQTLEYFSKSAPKSLGREWLESELLPIFHSSTLSFSDQSRTYAEFLSDLIVNALKPNQNCLVTGGGAHNIFLMQLISEKSKIKNCNILETNTLVIDFKEAIIFAWLGLMALHQKKNVLSSVTGAKKSTVSGAIHYHN